MATKRKKSFYWSFDGLSNYILYAGLDGDEISEEDVQFVKDRFAAQQQEIYDGFETLNEMLAGMDVSGVDNAVAKTAVTEYSGKMAKKTHELAIELIDYLSDGTLP